MLTLVMPGEKMSNDARYRMLKRGIKNAITNRLYNLCIFSTSILKINVNTIFHHYHRTLLPHLIDL